MLPQIRCIYANKSSLPMKKNTLYILLLQIIHHSILSRVVEYSLTALEIYRVWSLGLVQKIELRLKNRICRDVPVLDSNRDSLIDTYIYYKKFNFWDIPIYFATYTECTEFHSFFYIPNFCSGVHTSCRHFGTGRIELQAHLVTHILQ